MPRSSSGASANGANLVRPASAPTTPRAGADVTTSSATTSSSDTSASFVFDDSVHSVNGYAAHAYASTTPSVGPRTRRPSQYSPSSVSRSNTIAAACAAGRSSHVPLHPKISRKGTYA